MSRTGLIGLRSTIGGVNALVAVTGLLNVALAFAVHAAAEPSAAPAETTAPPDDSSAGAEPVPTIDFLRGPMTNKAPPGSEPPSPDPRNFAGVWTVESTRNQVLYELKPQWQGKLPAPALSSFGTLNIGSRQCHPTAYFGQMISVYPLLIAQTDRQINFLFEENRRTRRLYLDGRLPKQPVPAYFGHSVGHWEGDTLVVETIGLKGLVDFTLTGNPDLRIVERIKKVDGGGVLQFDVAYYNDRQWATPGTFTVRYHWRPDLSLMEVICEEFSDAYGRGYDSVR